MSGLVKTAAARVAPALRTGAATQRASLYTRPAKETLGTAVSPVQEALLTRWRLSWAQCYVAHLTTYRPLF